MDRMVLREADIKHTSWSSDVYEPSDDSFALVDAVKEHLQQLHSKSALHQLPSICVEVGCGSGYVICSVALAVQQLQQQQQQHAQPAQPDSAQQQAAAAGCGGACRFFATDISPAALQATAQTLAAHKVLDVELVQTDLVAGLTPHLAGAVDLLLFNPPYVPTPDEEVLRPGIARAWAGGMAGRRVTDRLLAQLPELMSPTGHAFIVTVPENRPQDIIGILAASGFTASIVLTRAADEESLQILHVHRLQAAAAVAAVAAAGATAGASAPVGSSSAAG